jgi:putative nucleotidyltransferase with HDIG domain
LSEKKNGELYSTDDLNLLGSFANEAAIAFSNAIAYDNLKKTYIGTIEAFAKAIEAKDIYTRGHSERVLKISMAIATEMGLPRDQIETLRYASILHDVGKIAIEDRILNKQGSLDTFEYEVIKQHPIVGANIVSTISFLNEAIDVVKHHHERYDGTGYPAGLKAENIPLLSRIISVADAFDAITSNRLYRQAVENNMAVEEISRCSEGQFDPGVVDAFLSAYGKNKIA